MIIQLTQIIERQNQQLKELEKLLKTQHEMIMKKDVFGLEMIVDKIKDCSISIAKEELERRNLIGEESLELIIAESDNDILKEKFRYIKITLQEVIFQKETNDMLLKQQIVFNNKILNLLNPNKEIKTYNSYGNLRR